MHRIEKRHLPRRQFRDLIRRRILGRVDVASGYQDRRH